MSVLNLANCGITTNMGLNTCVTNPGITRWAIALPKGTVIPASALASNTAFNAYLTAMFIADNGSQRAKLLPSFTTFTDGTGDAVTESQGNYEFVVQSKPYKWTYRMNTNPCAYKNMYELFNFNQDLWDFIFIDDKGVTGGTTLPDSTGANGLAGAPMAQVFTPDPVQKTDSANPMFQITFLLQNNQDLITNGATVDSNFKPNPATMGLVDVILSEGTVGTTSATVLYVSGVFACGGGSIGDTYGSDIAAAAAWSVVPASGGAAIVPSGVAYSATTKEYALTIASTPAAALIVGLAIPSVLTATPYFKYAITETPNKATITTP